MLESVSPSSASLSLLDKVKSTTIGARFLAGGPSQTRSSSASSIVSTFGSDWLTGISSTTSKLTELLFFDDPPPVANDQN